MSIKNVFGGPFVILNKNGYYDIYDSKGVKLDIPAKIIRVTQRVNDLDQLLIIGVCNVVDSVEEMEKLIKP